MRRLVTGLVTALVTGLMTCLVTALSLTLAACTPSNVTPPGPDASAAAAACANLARLGCGAGSDPACAGVLERAVTDNHTTRAHVACASSATSRGALTACGPYFASCAR